MSAELLAAIKAGDCARLRLLAESCGAAAADGADEFGTSVLSSAAFAGRPDMVEVLLRAGADPNKAADHPHGYTPLMFAALSGKAASCRALLEAGAEAGAQCSIGRTAAELAAFTGQHHTVSAINHFVPLDAILKALAASSAKLADPELRDGLVEAIHDLAVSANLHPVHLVRFLRDHPLLLAHPAEAHKVLEELREAEMKRQDTNEVMAIKVHIMLRVLKEARLWLEKEAGKRSESETLRRLSKHWLADGGEQLELLLRQAVKEFPFHQSSLFQGLVHTLAKHPPGAGPPALQLIRGTLNGQKMEMDEVFCAACGHAPSTKRCSLCKAARYCSQDCQKLHWAAHKAHCKQ